MMKMRAQSILAAGLLLAATAVADEPATGGEPTKAEAGLFGRGVYVDGDSRKYREDYDDLQSGGGFDFFIDNQRENGVYATGGGSFLFADGGDAFDAAELSVGVGRWGKYHVRGRLSLLQSYFDDSREGPLGAFPFTNDLGRPLHTNRADIDVEAKAFFGDGGFVSVRYLHNELHGDRSLLKGSTVEGLSPFSFRAPSFEDVDRQTDGVDLQAVVPIGPVDLAIDGAYQTQSNDTATNEINYAPSSLRDKVQFSNDFVTDIYGGGVSVSSNEDPRIQGHAGYRFAYVDSNADSAQTGGPTGNEPRRESDDIAVNTWTHIGHAGMVLRPISGLAIRASYAVRDIDRNASGTEQRISAVGAATQSVRNDSNRDSLTQSPRISAVYSGIPRTRIRASYSFDYIDRDLDWSSLTDQIGPAAVDRIQDSEEDVYRHRARVGARVRVARRTTGEVGYAMLREDIDQTVNQLVNEVVLGDRYRHRDRVFANLRTRTTRSSSLLLGAEWNRNKFRRTDVGGDSSSKVEGYKVSGQFNARPLSGLSTNATISWVDRDSDVGEDTSRALSIFRDIEFRDRHLAGAVLASWAATTDLTLRGRYSVAYVQGSFDNISQRVHADASYRASDLVTIAAGYSFLGFDQRLFDSDDFDGHFAWARCELTF